MAPLSHDPSVLLAVVEAQNELVAADLDLDAVMHLVCAKAQELTGADGACVELADGARTIRRAVDGDHAVPQSTLSVPLVDRGDPVGRLEVVSRHRRAIDGRDEDTLKLLSGLIAAQLRHAQVYARAEAASREDAVTGLANARAYHPRIESEVDRAIRHGRPLTVCLVEFDTAGDRPQPADAALRRIARALCDVRHGDQAFRIGPTTFALLLPETSEHEADVVLRRLHATLAVRDAAGTRVSVLTARKQARNRDVDGLQDALRDALDRQRRAPGRVASAA